MRRLPFLSDSPFVTRDGMSAGEERSSMLAAVKLLSEARIRREEQRAGLHLWRARSEALVGAGVLARPRLQAILADGAPKSRELGVAVDAESRVRALRWLLSDATWMDVDLST